MHTLIYCLYGFISYHFISGVQGLCSRTQSHVFEELGSTTSEIGFIYGKAKMELTYLVRNVGDASFVHILVYLWTERNTKGCLAQSILVNGK